MKHKRNILLPALIAPTLLAFASRGAEVSYHPEAGTVTTMSFENEADVSLEEMSMVQNGQEIDPSMMGEMDINTSTQLVVTVTDEVVSAKDGRPMKLVRSFDEISSSTNYAVSNQMIGEMNDELQGESELEGVKVAFQWDEDTGDYEVTFAEDSGGDEELLEGLIEGIDLRGLLPDAEVAEGDSWEVEAQSLRSLFVPGGSLKIEMEAPEEMGMGPQPSPDEALGDLEGEVTAEFAGLRDEGGVKVAVIKVTADISSAKDMTEFMEETMARMAEDQEMEMEMDVESMDMEFTFEGEGVLLWNVQSGMIYSMELSGETSQTIDTAMTLNMQGMEIAIEQTMVLSGTQTSTVTTESDS